MLEPSPMIRLMEESSIVQRPVLEPLVENLGKVGKNENIEHISVSGEGIPGLSLRYNPKLTKGQNWEGWRTVGEVGEEFIKDATDFVGKYKYNSGTRPIKALDKLKPDGFNIDYVKQSIRLGEIKPGTKSG